MTFPCHVGLCRLCEELEGDSFIDWEPVEVS